MTPFAGVGVNVAMEDALDLGRAIISCKSAWDDAREFTGSNALSVAVRGYEEAMFVRAEKYAKETWMYLNLFFNLRGGHAMVEYFAEAKKQEKAAAEAAAAATPAEGKVAA